MQTNSNQLKSIKSTQINSTQINSIQLQSIQIKSNTAKCTKPNGATTSINLSMIFTYITTLLLEHTATCI